MRNPFFFNIFKFSVDVSIDALENVVFIGVVFQGSEIFFERFDQQRDRVPAAGQRRLLLLGNVSANVGDKEREVVEGR